MATEIERKFLVVHDGWRTQADAGVFYRQGYLTDLVRGGKSSIRVRCGGGQAYLNIKSATLGVTRTEYDYAIPEADANEMLDRMTEGACIEKTRYHVTHAGHVWEIDVFAGANAGLVVAEIELGHEDEVFALPEWAGEEVSHDPRYYNVCLVQHPFKDWTKAG